MSKVDVRFITRTALILALTIVFQAVGRLIPLGPNSNFVVGPLVNTCLIIAAATAGILSGSIIAVLSPFAALLTGAAVPLPFVPFIAIGNLLLVLGFYILRRKLYLGIAAGAILKFAFLFVSIKVFLNLTQLPAKKEGALLLTFSWPQLVTAAVGGILAIMVIKLLPKRISGEYQA